MIMTETGTLPDGVEIDGVVHREFEVREKLIRDSVEIYADTEQAAKAESNAAYAGVLVMSRRIVKLGCLPTPIEPEILLDMTEDDYQELVLACKRLAERRRSFRTNGAAQPADGADAADAGA